MAQAKSCTAQATSFSLSEVEKTLADFQGFLSQNTEGMDMVMETAQALSEALNSM